MSAIGIPESAASSPGGSGSTNSHLRLVTAQLDAIQGALGAGGTGTASPTGSFANIRGFNAASWVNLLTPLAASGTTTAQVLGVGNLLWDGVRVWPARGDQLGQSVQGVSASGSTAQSFPVLSGMRDETHRLWPLRGDNLGVWTQGNIADGSAVGNARGVLGAGRDLSNNAAMLRSVALTLTNFGTALNAVLVAAANYAIRADGNNEQIKTAPAVSGTTGAGAWGSAILEYYPHSGQYHVRPAWLGTHGNAWPAATVVALNDTSAVLDTLGMGTVSVFGTSNANITLTLQYSQDGSNWYNSAQTIATGTAAFGTTFTVGARFVRLHSGGAATVTVTLSAKP